MRWPTWIDELRERYLADEANVFVLHGAVTGTTFSIDGESLDCVRVLERFLSRTRPIVGVLRPWPQPSRIEFAGVMDRTRFENLVKAHDFVEGRVAALQESEPSEALGRIWRALDTAGTDQAWLVTDAHRIAPAHRRRVDAIPGAPGFLEWPRHPGLRASNNLVVLLVEERDSLRSELLDGSAVVRVEPEPDLSSTPVSVPEFTGLSDEPTPTLVPDRELPEELDPPLTDQPEPTLVPAVEPATDPEPPVLRTELVPGSPAPVGAELPDALAEELRAALVETLSAYDLAARTALLPVMDATARVVAARQPERFGALAFSLDDEGEIVVTGEGSGNFMPLWRSDITLDAAGSMIVKELPEELGDEPDIDATGLRVLAKRLAKILDR